MKVTPISADLLVELALVAGAGLAIYLVAKQLKNGAAGVVDAAAAWADNVAQAAQRVATTTLNPASDQNAVYAPITTAVTAATGQDNSLGTWWRGLTSNDDQRVTDMLNGTSTGGATGSY